MILFFYLSGIEVQKNQWHNPFLIVHKNVHLVISLMKNKIVLEVFKIKYSNCQNKNTFIGK